MATYVMSDIHGEYEKYKKMLEVINFSDDDTLFVLGDVCDRGPDPVKVLIDMSMRANVYPIMGNHELMALDILEKLTVEITEENYATHLDDKFFKAMAAYQLDGGDVTLQKFKKLSPAERADLVEYIKDFAPYEIIDVNGKTFILVHSTLGNFAPDKPLSAYTLEELVWHRADYDKRLFDDEDIFVVSGHTPTKLICGREEIYQKSGNIAIDCGAAFGGKLACLCLDSMEEFYV
ncbi:MAG: fructose-bisphosphatase class III [Ruminococcaceae bacterium]|nr:fructose-bisphosphatase class III [Oscillospiraceae bacterium]